MRKMSELHAGIVFFQVLFWIGTAFAEVFVWKDIGSDGSVS